MHRQIPAYLPAQYPRGFVGTAIHAGIKKHKKAAGLSPPLDMALVVSTSPCLVGACFTKNQFQAAPVLVSRQILEGHRKESRTLLLLLLLLLLTPSLAMSTLYYDHTMTMLWPHCLLRDLTLTTPLTTPPPPH